MQGIYGMGFWRVRQVLPLSSSGAFASRRARHRTKARCKKKMAQRSSCNHSAHLRQNLRMDACYQRARMLVTFELHPARVINFIFSAGEAPVRVSRTRGISSFGKEGGITSPDTQASKGLQDPEGIPLEGGGVYS